jgi:two-component system response regulator YesN
MILLLVEDEPYTRAGILRSIDWHELGILTVHTADDGMEGLDKARTCAPDIVLTDMRMPRMSGPDMAEEIRRILPDCAFVYMSGYSDRAYYRSAIHVSALDYVSKPIQMPELRTALSNACRHVERLHETEECVLSFRSQELAALLTQRRIAPDTLARLWELNRLPERPCGVTTMLLHHEYSPSVRLDAHDAARAMGVDALVARINPFSVIHLVVPSTRRCQAEEYAARLLHAGRFIAIGDTASDAAQAGASYESARSAYDAHFYHPERGLLTSRDRSRSLDMGVDPTHEFAGLLLRDSAAARGWAVGLFRMLREYDGTPVDLVRYWMLRMLTDLSFLVDRTVAHALFGGMYDEAALWTNLLSLGTLEQTEAYFLRVLDDYKAFDHDDGPCLPLVLDMKRFVHVHYINPLLSLDDIASHVKLSPNYASQVFRDATGATIHQYLTDWRIRRARLLISTTNMRIQQVAKSVGYSSSSYFIRAFHEVTGNTPLSYRKDASCG